MKHLVREMHDVVHQPISIWCKASWNEAEATEEIDEVTCEDCLTEVVAYGNAALARRGQLRRERGKK